MCGRSKNKTFLRANFRSSTAKGKPWRRIRFIVVSKVHGGMRVIEDGMNSEKQRHDVRFGIEASCWTSEGERSWFIVCSFERGEVSVTSLS